MLIQTKHFITGADLPQMVPQRDTRVAVGCCHKEIEVFPSLSY